MKSKIKKIVVSIFLAALCVIAGFLIGNYSRGGEKVETVVTEQTPVVSEPANKINFKDTIAIVNLDEGLMQGGNTLNYGNSLISTIDVDVRVTGLQDARNGIENGDYSAYIVIPTTFSANVMTINEKPVTSEITYAIAPALEGEKRDNAICNVYSIYNSFSNSVTQIYTATILDEYHDAQDAAHTIMANDTKDMNTLLEIQGYNLVEITTIPELSKVENKITDLNLNSYLGNYGEQINGIQTTYAEYCQNTQQKLTGLLELSTQVSLSTNQWDSTEVLDAQDGQAGIATEMQELKTAHAEYAKQNNLTDELLQQAQEEEFAGYDSKISEISDKIGVYDEEMAAYIESELTRYKYLELSYNNIIECLEDFKADNGESESEIEIEGVKIPASEYTYEFYTVDDFTNYKKSLEDAVTEEVDAQVRQALETYKKSVKSNLVVALTGIENNVKNNQPDSILGNYESIEDCAAAILDGSWNGNNNEKPTESPTEAPTESPTEEPTEEPTEAPTEEPTEAPTEVPTEAPTEEPTEAPTEEPTEAPTEEPTETPTEEPTESPTEAPMESLAEALTEAPTEEPTEEPTEAPTEEPTEAPTEEPTEAPTEEPTENPTEPPTEEPTESPTDITTPGTSVVRGTETEPTKFKITVFKEKIEFNTSNKPVLDSADLTTDFLNSVKTQSTAKTDVIVNELNSIDSMIEQYDRADEFYGGLKSGLNNWAESAAKVIQPEDTALIQSYVSQMTLTTRSIESTVKTHDIEYKTYATDVYTTTEKNITTLKEYIVQSQQLSEQKVFDGLEVAKLSRTANNQTNVGLLKSLTTRLSYTRLGNVENREVYTFMAKPITLFDVSDPIKVQDAQEVVAQVTTVTTTVNEGESMDMNIIWMLSGLVVLLVVAGIVSAVLGTKKPTEDF